MVQYATCKNCKGTGDYYTKGGKRLDCKACNGSGSNKKYWQSNCQNCYDLMVYPAGQDRTFCKNCRNIQKTKTCEQWGCYNTLSYKIGWSEIPSYCKSCFGHRKHGDSAKTCSKCSNLIWVPTGKNFTMCRDCNQSERDKKAAQWKTKSCKECRSEIKYHVDWSHVPDLCKSCKEKAKAQWKEKPCAGGCGNVIKYHVDWDHPPNFCNSCKKRQNKVSHESNQSENKRFYAACYKAGLTRVEIDRFSEEEFHHIPDRERLSFEAIKKMAEDWKRNSGGGFRRSDRY